MAFAPRHLRWLEAQINHHLLAVRIERMRRLVRILLEQRRMKFPNLQAVGPELARLGSEIEDDARKFIDGLDAVRARKQNTFDAARKHVGDAHAALADINSLLSDLDKATNGGPTSGASQESSASAQPSEHAALNQGQPG